MSNLKDFVIEDGILKKYVGQGGDVVIPDGVRWIRDAFRGCGSLTSITIPNSVTCIGNSAFSHCKNLENVTIPDSVTSIGYSSFSGCEKLETIIIPEGVTDIDHEAFGGCTNLKKVILKCKIDKNDKKFLMHFAI